MDPCDRANVAVGGEARAADGFLWAGGIGQDVCVQRSTRRSVRSPRCARPSPEESKRVSVELRRAFSHYATGVTIVTAIDAAGKRVGITANSFSSLSLDPPLILWSLAKSSTSYEAFRATRHFAVHVLDSAQTALAKQFATKDIDRFADVVCATGGTGVPLLCDYHARFECETYAQYDGGDHTIFVGRVLQTDEKPGDPLLFYRGRFANVAPAAAGVQRAYTAPPA